MALQAQEQFYHLMTRLKTNSRVASTLPIYNILVTEIVNRLIVSKPAKNIEYISEPFPKISEPQAEAQVWKLSKDGPVLEQQQACSCSRYQ